MGKKGRLSSRNQQASIASCVICGSSCVLEVDGATSQKRVRCTQCGETYALVLAPVARDGWTVVDPKGNVSTFEDSDAARDSMPTSKRPSLILEDQSDPHLVSARSVDSDPEPHHTPILGTVHETPTVIPPPSKPPTVPPPKSGRDDVVSEEHVESLPSSTMTKAADSEPGSLDPEDLVEAQSARPAEVRRSIAPPLPKRASNTLPAGSTREPPAMPPIEREVAPRIVLATHVDAEPAEPPRTSKTPSSPRLPVGLRKPVTVEQAEPERMLVDEPPSKPMLESLDAPERGAGRTWLVAVGVFALLGIGFFAYSRNADPAAATPKASVSAEPTTVATSSAKPVASVVASASAPAAASAAPATSVVASASAAPPASAVPSATAAAAAASGEAAPAVTADNPNQPTSDILHAAHAALRKNDPAAAAKQFERVLGRDPNNVEAIAGLGDIARAQGDLAKAKTSYQSALEKAPHYMPAQLALADLKWDGGEKGDAVQRYAAIVEKLGDSAPARAKERANAQ